MGRGAGVRGVAALVAVLGSSMLLCASASAKMAQTIMFTSAAPSDPVAGGSYTVSASETSGMQVFVAAVGACSFGKPGQPNAEDRLEAERVEEQPLELLASPVTVYFIGAGTCRIDASGSGDSEYEPPPEASQSFPVARDPSEQITFTSTPPSDATVGDSYDPVVRLSAGIRVSFFTTTPSVCAIAPLHAAVSLVGVGTCTIGVRQNGVSESEPPEGKQSFDVIGPAAASPQKTSTKTHRAQCPAKKCATLIVHVYSTVGSEVLPGEPERLPDEVARSRITRLGHDGKVLSSSKTTDRTLRLAPGLYEIALAVHAKYTGRRRVTVHAGQTLEVTLTVITH